MRAAKIVQHDFSTLQLISGIFSLLQLNLETKQVFLNVFNAIAAFF